MDQTRRILPLAALSGVAAALAAKPAAACDPDTMDAHLTAGCDGALAPARAALEAALPHATPAERLAMQRALSAADQHLQHRRPGRRRTHRRQPGAYRRPDRRPGRG